MDTRFRLFALWAMALAFVALPARAEDFKQENTPDNLKATLVRLHRLIHQERNLEEAERTFKSLLPNKERLRKALADDIPDERFEAFWALHLQLGAATPDLSRALPVESSDVHVYGATTEEIAQNKEDSVVFKEFPGGAVRLAELKLLRPGTTFYAVVFAAPGQSSGRKFHLIYWDGKQWTMAGPLWRAVRD
ncbi:MAG TPA: hypothetical protein PKD86_18900 [Gemmatales bacterium]|nr:hypothetical protein [Gemmatales bacterium]HMP61415.1 hypothetical protein [Gemmatales bacterium]